MAGDIANAILVPIVQKLITPVVDAVARQFGYVFCYKSNIKNLERTVKRLGESRDDVDNFFKAESWNNKERAQYGTGWLNDIEEMTMAAKEVVEAKDKLKWGCLNLKSRYVLSRKSTKLATDIQELQDRAPKIVATNSALPAGMQTGALSNDASKDFKTRTEIMDKVMKALENETINIIGICGLGGIGKTTILHEVRERARTEKLFVEIAMTTVTQDQNLFKIQSDLASMLGLSLKEDEGNIIARADKLHKRLTNGNTILVVLDDVWSEIKLQEVGIPVGNDRAKCKVILASRYKYVCTSMGTQETISVEELPKEEAWHLFKKVAGDCVEKENLEKIAKEVAGKCGGLPIALVTLAKALSNKKREVWVDARRQQKEGWVTSIHGMNKNVYSSLRLSFDFLKSELPEAQPLLLICCQHPEDAVIKVEKLARYCLALKLFRNVDKVVEARNRTYTVIDHLKSCFLLQEAEVDAEEKHSKYETVKMHDVIRDVCLSIVSEMKEERDKVYMHIMAPDTDGGYELGTGKVDYPKLKLLMEAPLNGKLLDITFLEQMEGLRVFENVRGCEDHLPPALQVLKNLRMLSLERKHLSEEIISAIGSLSSLEILSFWRSEISSFPRQIGQLRNLKLLDLRCKKGEGFVPSGMLSGLKQLEVLCMGHFLLSGLKDKDIENGENRGRITELDSLSNLTTLQIKLHPNDLLDLQRFRFEDLESFLLGWGTFSFCKYRSRLRSLVKKKTIRLGNIVGMKWVLEPKIEHVINSTMKLQLEDVHDWTDRLILEKFVSLRALTLKNCKLEYVIPEGSLGLRRLHLIGMPMMRCLCVGTIDPLCFGNLVKIKIDKCPGIESVFPYSAAKCLVQLQVLGVFNCERLEGFVCKGELGAATNREPEITEELFPKLRMLQGTSLPKLGGFYDHALDNGTTQQAFLNPLIMGGGMLQNLEVLEIYGCNSLGYLMSSTMAHMLVNLETLDVQDCKSMKEVVEVNEDHYALKKIVFRSLRIVYLGNCGELSSFCSSEQQSFEFPSLEEVCIDNCPKMKTFCCGHFTAEKLHGVNPKKSDKIRYWKVHLNETAQHLKARVDQMTGDLKENVIPEKGIDDEYAECPNEGTLLKASIPPSVVSSPNVSLTPVVVSPSPPVPDNNEELANSSSPDLRKVALPPFTEFVPSASMEQSLHSSDSSLQPKADKELSDMSLSSWDDDLKRNRILIQGVYVKSKLKTAFEEILTAKPNFLSGLRLKTGTMKTEAVESAIRSLQILRHSTSLTISPEELAYIKDSLDDLESNGLDTTWLKRGYERAILAMKKRKVVSAAAELALLEREKTEDEAALELTREKLKMARAKLEASTARRDAFKAEYGAFMQELEAGKELFGGDFDLETSLGNGLLD